MAVQGYYGSKTTGPLRRSSKIPLPPSRVFVPAVEFGTIECTCPGVLATVGLAEIGKARKDYSIAVLVAIEGQSVGICSPACAMEVGFVLCVFDLLDGAIKHTAVVGIGALLPRANVPGCFLATQQAEHDEHQDSGDNRLVHSHTLSM